ncbi:MAG: Na(+)/H(+) antiporter subunit B, partial [Spirochaetota bacterium]
PARTTVRSVHADTSSWTSTPSLGRSVMMHDIAYLSLLMLIVVTALGAVLARGYITSVVVLSVFSVFATVTFAMLQAVDVAMAEAAIGAGFMTAIFVTAIDRMRSKR